MCKGFGTIVTKNMDVYFTMFDEVGDIHHSDIIEALGIEENRNPFLRSFVRTENPVWTTDSFRFDEPGTLPGWVEENKEIIRDKVNVLMLKSFPALKEYEAIQQQAWKEYKAIQQPALKEYEAIQQPAWKEYKAIKQQAWKEYLAIEQPAWKEYEAIDQQAWKEYEAIQQPAWADARTKLRQIAGYVEGTDDRTRP